jgi:hypothetical protein
MDDARMLQKAAATESAKDGHGGHVMEVCASPRVSFRLAPLKNPRRHDP